MNSSHMSHIHNLHFFPTLSFASFSLSPFLPFDPPPASGSLSYMTPTTSARPTVGKFDLQLIYYYHYRFPPSPDHAFPLTSYTFRQVHNTIRQIHYPLTISTLTLTAEQQWPNFGKNRQ